MPALRADYRFIDPARFFPGTIVVVAPHMDDEVLACGGTIAQLSHRAQVHVVYATDGARSYSPSVPWLDRTSPELGTVRKTEAKAALQVLGVSSANLHFLDFPDGELERHAAAFERSFIELLRRLRPDYVLVPFRYDRHPDHLAANRAVHSSLQREGSCAQLVEYFVYYRWRLLRGGDVRTYLRGDELLAVDIQAVAARKRASLDCFRSQTTPDAQWQTRPVLSQASLDEVCRQPEVFLRYDPALAGVAVFTGSRAWIRFVHAFEPAVKRRKDEVMALIRKGMGGYA